MNVLIVETDRISEERLSGNYTQIKIYEQNVVLIQSSLGWHMKLPHDLLYLKKDIIQDNAYIVLQYPFQQSVCELYFYTESNENYELYQYKEVIHLGPKESDDISFMDNIEIDWVKHKITTTSARISLNGKRIRQETFHTGDVLLGKDLRILFGPSFLKIRQRKETITLSKYNVSSQHVPLPHICFSYSPYIEIPLLVDEITLQSPKHIQPYTNERSIVMMLPSILMMVTLLFVSLLNVYRSDTTGKTIFDILPMIFMPAVMLVSVVVIHPFINFIQKKKYQKKIKKRNEEYKKYLSDLSKTIKQNQLQYYTSLYLSDVPVEVLLQQIKRHILPIEKDELFIGRIHEDLVINIKYPQLRENEDDILPIVQGFQASLRRTVYVPFLTTNQNILIEGENGLKLFLSLLIQACFYRTDVTLVCELSLLEGYPFLLRLPGLMNHEQRRIFTHETAENVKAGMIFQAHFTKENKYCITFDETQRAVKLLLHVGHENWYEYVQQHKRGKLYPDLYMGTMIHTTLPAHSFQSKQAPSFLEMYHVKQAKYLQIAERWKMNQDTRSTKAFLGVDEYGQNIVLDINEAGNGPHGLIAGTTGSGKSELILTLLLSFMINYAPTHLQVAFIDFKGGSACQALSYDGKPLPHIVGSLSNLEENLKQRVMYALKNECLHRQRSFIQASHRYHCSIKNLSDYRLLQRKESSLEDIADLVIVVDEFAELKTQNYEMLSQLISTARIGRSLGIHLILSTQKPAGVVNDQIWANSRFKICLKVSDKQDSMEVLHTIDATTLKKPGEFIMECDGQIEKGICGYSGYRKSLQNMTLHTLDEKGDIIEDYSAYGEYANGEIESICEQIGKAWHETPMRKLWLDPIETCDSTDCIQHQAIGIADDYYQQRQSYVTMPYLSGDHWAFLIPDRELCNQFFVYIKQLFRVNHPVVKIYEFDENSIIQQKDVVLLQKKWSHASENKVIFISDAALVYQKLGSTVMHQLFENSKESHLQFIFSLSRASSIPYYDMNQMKHKVCMQNQSVEEMSSFMGVRVHQPIKEKNTGYIMYGHLLMMKFCL